MKSINGKFTDAKIFTDVVDETAIQQIQELCDQEFLKDTTIRVMPDVHAGKGCTIGTTIKIKDKVVPNLVGVDVGCGVLTIQLEEKDIDFSKLDKVIREHVPSGQNIHEELRNIDADYLDEFKTRSILSEAKFNKSLGTLGGGNHYIEISRDEDGYLYLSIHTGSRYIGSTIANHYQKVAYRELRKIDVTQIIEQLKSEGKHKEIESSIKKLNESFPKIKKDLAYLEGDSFDDYIHDMKLAQKYAVNNRQEIANIIINRMNLNKKDEFDTIHNYIDTDNMILRKGAVSAQKGERLIIPINMRDGSIIAVGKGNPDWNYSAPHGAGRVLSRSMARKQLILSEYKDTMKDVWTTSVSTETIDEAPMAYKRMEDILDNIGDTVEIVKIIKPVYNFKAAEEQKIWMKKKK
ncbi:RtcB family protein [Heyndrickxia sp. NPDC080065]|uniref:RtcB family protein n=1 Tax=Heyndrickxia sp. NPDC080065 TaxID=3390568 RepID=UPI003CFD7F88